MRKIFTRSLALFCSLVMILSCGGVWATWKYALIPMADAEDGILIGMSKFEYVQDIPDGEVTLIERIGDLLNNAFSNEEILEGEGMNYLLSTLDKDWETGHNPALGSFVGSMDPTPESRARVEAMFGDIIELNRVSFILKSEDLVGSVDNEISLYSTSDPLDYDDNHWTPTVVGVYLSVFVPIVDENGITIGYEQLCDSIHGYCMEVWYMDGIKIPSFSTDHWRDELYYWHEKYANPVPIVGEDRYKYECYHTSDGNYAYPGRSYSWLGWINVQSNQWAIGD